MILAFTAGILGVNIGWWIRDWIAHRQTEELIELMRQLERDEQERNR